MKNKFTYIIFSLIVLLSSGFVFQKDSLTTLIKKPSWNTGEELSYRLHYGFINAGRATISVDNKLYNINNKVCHQLNVFGKSSGTFDLMLRIRDTWRSYIDTTNFQPQKSFRNIEEGKYRLKEEVYYDYQTNKAKVTKYQDKKQENFEFGIPSDIQDIVSGFYKLRRIDFNKLKINDTIFLNVFFDNQIYNFSVKYKGKEHIKTDGGHFNAIKIVPIMPQNKLFKGEESIKAWISDDQNKIPLKVEAEMFVGSVILELTDYKNLKFNANRTN